MRINRRPSNSTSMQYIFIMPAVAFLVLLSLLSEWMMQSTEKPKVKYSSTTANFQKWQTKQFKNYSYLLNSTCHNAKKLRIEIRNNIQVWPTNEEFPTIEELFAFADYAKDKADHANIHFHPEGYPRWANINWNEDYFDYGCGFRLTQLTELTGIGQIPSIDYKRRIFEPRYYPQEWLPKGVSWSEFLSNSYGKLWTKEERENMAKQNIQPASPSHDSL